MFTGIIEEVGTVKEVRRSGNSSYIKIQAEKVLSDFNAIKKEFRDEGIQIND